VCEPALKPPIKSRSQRGNKSYEKRTLLSELKEGITSFTTEREEKLTLKRVHMAEQEVPIVAPEKPAKQTLLSAIVPALKSGIALSTR
jgi:hypothetical protein